MRLRIFADASGHGLFSVFQSRGGPYPSPGGRLSLTLSHSKNLHPWQSLDALFPSIRCLGQEDHNHHRRGGGRLGRGDHVCGGFHQKRVLTERRVTTQTFPIPMTSVSGGEWGGGGLGREDDTHHRQPYPHCALNDRGTPQVPGGVGVLGREDPAGADVGEEADGGLGHRPHAAVRRHPVGPGAAKGLGG